MTQALNDSIDLVVNQYTKFNRTGVNCVNKGATSIDSFKEDVYLFMDGKVPEEHMDRCWLELYNAAWSYDILTQLINDDGAISDIAVHSWDNVWVQERGKWRECDFHFRNPEHYDRFFIHVCSMNNITMNNFNASDNCTDISTCADFRLRLNFVHNSINTDGCNVFSIRKIPKVKKTLEVLSSAEEGMITEDMIPIIRKHIQEATGILIVGMGGSGKTTFLNAVIEELPKDWKFLFIQENEELFSDTRRNSDFLKTVKGINQYDASHDLKELSRNGLLMSVRCFVIGETKGGEALYLFNVMNTGALGITTAHSDSSEHGLDKLADYIKYESDYTKDQCMSMLTITNKVFFLKDYRLREISTIKSYDIEKHKLVLDTEYFNPNPIADLTSNI